MKIVTVIGARPQFVKASAVSRVIRQSYGSTIEELIIHTGQHYDQNMSKVFFDELSIPLPAFNLNIGALSHGAMTGRMLEGLEAILLDQKPDWVLVYGDTNSTLAGALAAIKLHIPIAHVEAGLRSRNIRMPEEVNRILTDRVSTMLFCPTQCAVSNLSNEGVIDGVHNVGDVMYDVALHYREIARQRCDILARYGLPVGGFVLATCHRAENTDDVNRLQEIILALKELAEELPVVLPLHPRTRKLVDSYGLGAHLTGISVARPLPFLEMLALEQAAKVIVTDSGGVQKEAFFYGVPCVTVRDETEWLETIRLGWNKLVDASRSAILSAVRRAINCEKPAESASPYGSGDAANKIVSLLSMGR